jgi:hypothetical protein
MTAHAKTALFSIVLTIAMISTAACQHDATSSASRGGAESSHPSAPGATPPTTLTGKLSSGALAVGGETTGWRIIGDGQTGGVDVDVSKVRDHATALDGKRVTITGRMTSRSWPERGDTPILAAEKIEPAAEPRR